MKRLSKDQEKARTEIVDRLNAAAVKLRDALGEVNLRIENDLNLAISIYNEALSDAESFRDEIVSDMETYADERSENWRNGEAGSNHESWKGEWESFDVDQIDSVEEIEEPDMGHADSLDQLPSDTGF